MKFLKFLSEIILMIFDLFQKGKYEVSNEYISKCLMFLKENKY